MALRNTIFLVLVNDVLQLPEQRLLSVGRIILLCSLRVASEMIGVLTSASDMLCQETYSSDHFFSEIGVLYWHLDPKKSESEEELLKIRKDRGYSYMVCTSPTNSQSLFAYLYLCTAYI